jgi:hypothetical protein
MTSLPPLVPVGLFTALSLSLLWTVQRMIRQQRAAQPSHARLLTQREEARRAIDLGSRQAIAAVVRYKPMPRHPGNMRVRSARALPSTQSCGRPQRAHTQVGPVSSLTLPLP